MEFSGENYKFTVPDKLTVRKQLEYFSAGAGLPIALRHWEGAKVVIETWESPLFPDYKADIEKETNPAVTSLIIQVGRDVITFMNSLDDVPKN